MRHIREESFRAVCADSAYPFTVAELIEQLVLRVLRIDRESSIERTARGDNAQILVEHDERFAHRVDDRVRERRSVVPVDKLFAEHL
jgi:hypothetical protein